MFKKNYYYNFFNFLYLNVVIISNLYKDKIVYIKYNKYNIILLKIY